MLNDTQQQDSEPLQPEKKLDVEAIFSDHESKHNLVGFFNLLLKVDKRKNPEKYKEQVVVKLQDND